MIKRLLLPLILIGSFVNLLPTLFWIQEININLSGYYIFFQVLLIFLITFNFIKIKKHKIILLTILLFFAINSLFKLSLFFLPTENNLSASRQDVSKYYYANLSGLEDYTKFKSQISEHKADVILLLEAEITNDFNNFAKAYPYRREVYDIGSLKMLMLSKYPFVGDSITTVGEEYPEFIIQKIHFNEKEVNVLLWHARQPLLPENFHVNKVLCRRLANIVRHSDEKYLVFGDFNATPFSNCYKFFSKTDSLSNAMFGRGMQSTWHAKNPFINLTLDHIFYTKNIINYDYKRLGPLNSDHYPILTTFSF